MMNKYIYIYLLFIGRIQFYFNCRVLDDEPSQIDNNDS